MKATTQPPRDCDEEAAKYERYREVAQKDYPRVEKERREKVRNLTLFSASLMFDAFEEAMQARRELCAAGCAFQIRDALDPYCHGTTFAEAWRSSRAGRLDEEELWRQLEAIIAPLGGEIVEAGLIEDLAVERQLHRSQ